jgi:class 3 adenylate cyclase/ABC-type transport system substrate-binding protein
VASGSEDGTAERGSAEIRTFLIADVRGYTLFTQERGDEAAGKLAKRFADVAREGIEGRGGILLELRGDEALAVFTSARQAIRAAVELQGRFVDETVADPSLPLRVGIGIDAGEAVPIEGGYRGRALNLAARLCGLAGPGEVLASREAVHLAGTVEGARFVDRGAVHLKGLTAPVHVTRVLPVSGDPAELLRPFAPPSPKRRRDRRVVLGVGALALAAIVVAVALPLVRSAGSGIQLNPGTVLFDLAGREEVRSIPASRLAVPGYPRFAGGSFWLTNFDPSAFIQIDPATGGIVREISTPARDPDATGDAWSETPYTVDGDTLWVAAGPDVVKIDIAEGEEIDRLELDEILGGEGSSQGVAVGDGSLWVSRLSGIGQIARLTPGGDVLERWDNISPHGNLAFADGSLWVADNGGVLRIDAATNRIVHADGVSGNFRVAAGGGFGWTTNEDEGVVYKINPDGTIAATYATGLGAAHMAFLDGTLWVANHDVGTITGIDAVTGTTRTLRFGHPVTTIAAGAGRLLIGVRPGRSIEDSIDALTGDVAKLIAYKSQIGDGDPAFDSGPAAFQIAYATCAKLLNYPDRSAPAGWQLRPEVAAAMPDISADGRTYTFTIRPGYRFSPPENEELTARTFRDSIERALSPRLGDGTFGPMFIDDIEGEREFREGSADHISGLRVEGDTLSITLVAPSADFLHRLALPFFCPVPADTPVVRGGVAKGGTVFGGYHLPAAGPYYVADLNNEEYVILKRNPNYSGPRPQHFDAIVLREGIDAGLAVERIEQEGWDGITTLFDPLLDPGRQLDLRWGPESGAGSNEPTYFPGFRPQTGFIAFNAGRGIFADPKVRRAASLALDRSALAAVYAQTPTDGFFPPSVPGSQDPSEVSPPRPDLDEAIRLMDGKSGAAVMPVFEACDPCLTEAQIVRDDLAEIGIDVRIRRVSDFDVILEPGPRYDLLDWGTEFLYPDPASFLEQMLLHDVPEGWLPAGIREEVERVNGLEGRARFDAAIRLARRLQTKDVPLVAVGTTNLGTVIGPRLGCRVFPPFGFGVDLAALCPADGS